MVLKFVLYFVAHTKGIGSGRSKWIVHLQGGAWCVNETDCLLRSQGFFGTSKNLSKLTSFSQAGILSHIRRLNPDFYNWNMVFVIYCDGGSFTGYRYVFVFYLEF